MNYGHRHQKTINDDHHLKSYTKEDKVGYCTTKLPHDGILKNEPFCTIFHSKLSMTKMLQSKRFQSKDLFS